MNTLSLDQLDEKLKSILDFKKENPVVVQTDLYRIEVEQGEYENEFSGWKRHWEIRIGYVDSFYKWQQDTLSAHSWSEMAKAFWKYYSERPKGRLYPVNE